jgi:hypothetical protein
MKQLKNIDTFNYMQEYNYVIDWNLYEGEIEYDVLNEEIKVIFSEHGGKNFRMEDFKIEPWEIEELVHKASEKLIREYNADLTKKRQHFLLRDRSKEIPYEIIMVVDKGREFPTEKTHIAVVGELYSKAKIDRLKREFKSYRLASGDPDIPFINYLQKTGTEIQNGDYAFQVITTRRKEDFRVDSKQFVILEIHPDQTIRVAE